MGGQSPGDPGPNVLADAGKQRIPGRSRPTATPGGSVDPDSTRQAEPACPWASQVAQTVKNTPAMRETWD